MSKEEYLTSKIFVEYYNKLVLEINKIIKRIEKIEGNYESLSLNSSFFNLKNSGNLNNNLIITPGNFNNKEKKKSLNETPNLKMKKKIEHNRSNIRTKSLNQKDNIFNILDKIKIISDSSESSPKEEDNNNNNNKNNIEIEDEKKILENSKRFKKIKKNIIDSNTPNENKTPKSNHKRGSNKDYNSEFSFKNILAPKQSNQNSTNDLKQTSAQINSRNSDKSKIALQKTYQKKCSSKKKINNKFSSIIKTFNEKNYYCHQFLKTQIKRIVI